MATFKQYNFFFLDLKETTKIQQKKKQTKKNKTIIASQNISDDFV